MNPQSTTYNTLEQRLLRFFLSIVLLSTTAGCGTTRSQKQGSLPETQRSPWLQEDTGAALVLLPIFIACYPLELLSNWEISQWKKNVSQLKIGMSPKEVSKILGWPTSKQKISSEKEIWHYGKNLYPGKLTVVFDNKAVSDFEENAP